MNDEVHMNVPARYHTDSDPILEDHPTRSHQEQASSNEAQSEDLEYGSSRCCRICFSHEAQIDDELISPCMCKGTQQVVHRQCLDNWRSVKEGFAFLNCTTCKARYHLRIEEIKEDPWRKAKFILLVFRDLLLILLAAHVVIAVFGGLGYLYYKIPRRMRSRNIQLPDSWIRQYPIPLYYLIGFLWLLVFVGIFGLIWAAMNEDDPDVVRTQDKWYGLRRLNCSDQMMEAHVRSCCLTLIFCFMILGIPYGIMATTIAIKKIRKRHYNILHKRELTQEYIVVDLHGRYYTPPDLDSKHEERLKMLNLLIPANSSTSSVVPSVNPHRVSPKVGTSDLA